MSERRQWQIDVDLLAEAATKMRDRATAATPSPWRDSPVGDNRYGAVISDTKPGWRESGGGWDETEHYGGYLVGESIRARDRTHITTWHPAVALAVADWLDTGANKYACVDRAPMLAVARAYLGHAS